MESEEEKPPARERFGRIEHTEEHGDMWKPDLPKFKGMCIAYARDVDTIEGHAQSFEPQYVTDQFWQWASEKLGDEFGDIFRDGDVSPSGKFDRVTKSLVEGLMDSLYGSHDEFTELCDEKWQEVVPEFGEFNREQDTCSELEGKNPSYMIDLFYEKGAELEYEVERGDDVEKRVTYKKGEPKPEMFKYYLKQYAAEKKGFGFDEMPPSAEEYVGIWIDWLDNHWQSSTKFLVDDEDKYDGSIFSVAKEEDVVQWARELWKEDERFRTMLKSKWVLDVGDSSESGGDEPEFKRMERPNVTQNRSKKGQMDMGDYT